jgi:hypothetical protein
VRVSGNRNTDTPLPPDEPAGENPPDGAILDYRLPAGAAAVMLEVLDARGALVRRWSSLDPPDTVRTEGEIPDYWIRPRARLSAAAGSHRFVWDLRGAPLATRRRNFSIAATPHGTPAEPRGPWVLPGDYTVKLHAGGRTLERPLKIEMDPRVKTPRADLERQWTLASHLTDLLRRDSIEVERVHAATRGLPGTGAGNDSLRSEAQRIESGAPGGSRRRSPDDPPTLTRVQDDALRAYGEVQGSDAAPTAALEQACVQLDRDFAVVQARVERLEERARAMSRR